MGSRTTYVSLLRGINVGGNNKVSMPELKACFEKMGFRDVTTYINSGNVIFRTPETNPRQLEATIEKGLSATFSLPISVAVRSLAEMDGLMTQLPKSWQNPAGLKCNVIFLRPAIDSPNILKQLNPKPGIEEVHYHPGVLFWSAQTSNLTKSNMLKIVGTPMYKEMTIRILNSVRKIHEIMKTVDKA